MGWERKRGKLRELNRLLRGATDTSFLPPDPGAAPAPSGIRYVITLDADTRLPAGGGAPAGRHDRASAEPARLRRRGVARRRGARHPPAAGDADAARDGMGNALPARLLGPAGHRPLRLRGVRRVPGPLRRGDLHGQGDLRRGRVRAGARRPRSGEHAALPRSLRGSLRPRRASSRTSSSSKGFPAHYEVAASRQHRWVRGDWQLLPWILRPRARRAGAAAATTRFRRSARWKMLDNLRRSLSPPATFATARGRVVPARGAAPGRWTAFVLGVYALPTLLAFFGEPPAEAARHRQAQLPARASRRTSRIGLAQAALRLTLLAHAAWLRADAIGRTLWRLCVSRRHLLEWMPAAQAHRALDLKVGGLLSAHARRARARRRRGGSASRPRARRRGRSPRRFSPPGRSRRSSRGG